MNKQDFTYQFYESLRQFFIANHRDVSEFFFKKNKSTNNIILKSDIFFQFKKPHEVCLKNSREEFLKKHNIDYSKSAAKNDTIPLKIYIENLTFINDNAEFLLEVFDDIYLKNNPNAFSFCSKWKQCCDNLHCMESDPVQASLCRSRKNIMNGLVFNGKNSVLDSNGAIIQEKVKENLSKIPTSKVVRIDLSTHNEQINLFD